MHPPMLYLGYVGFSVAFAFAVAALLEGKLDESWARWTRPWTTVAWMFLTVGIALGSWWAYYELGWGGWWFWDPVENASFMPWLVGTALIHSLAVTEKRGLFKSWTLLLAIVAFSLSLLGTFLVRSGVLVSVHAFASDPGRGLFILMFLAICIGGSLALYAWRGPGCAAKGGFDAVSRESFLLFNNVLLLVAAALILVGTLYPLFLDALRLGKISVGPPYFNLVFLIPMLPLLRCSASACMRRGRRAGSRRSSSPCWRSCLWQPRPACCCRCVAYGGFNFMSSSVVTGGVWVILSRAIRARARLRGRQRCRVAWSACAWRTSESACLRSASRSRRPIASRKISRCGRARASSCRATTSTSRARTRRGSELQGRRSPRSRSRADGKLVAALHPQKRIYRVQRSPMTEAGIEVDWNRDLFVAMGEDLGDGAWSMRVQYKPLVRFIWLGALVMALGGFIAITDRRYRTRNVAATMSRAGRAARARTCHGKTDTPRDTSAMLQVPPSRSAVVRRALAHFCAAGRLPRGLIATRPMCRRR